MTAYYSNQLSNLKAKYFSYNKTRHEKVASLLLYNNGAILLCQCFLIIPCSNAVMYAYFSNQLSNLKAKYFSYNETRHEKVASLLLYNNGAILLCQCFLIIPCSNAVMTAYYSNQLSNLKAKYFSYNETRHEKVASLLLYNNGAILLCQCFLIIACSNAVVTAYYSNQLSNLKAKYFSYNETRHEKVASLLLYNNGAILLCHCFLIIPCSNAVMTAYYSNQLSNLKAKYFSYNETRHEKVASLLLYNNGAILLCHCFLIIACSNAVVTAYYSNQLSNLKAKYFSYNETRHEKVASLLLYNNGAVLLCQCFSIIPCSKAVMTAYYSNQLSNLKAKYFSYNETRHEKVASLLLYNNGAILLCHCFLIIACSNAVVTAYYSNQLSNLKAKYFSYNETRHEKVASLLLYNNGAILLCQCFFIIPCSNAVMTAYYSKQLSNLKAKYFSYNKTRHEKVASLLLYNNGAILLCQCFLIIPCSNAVMTAYYSNQLSNLKAKYFLYNETRREKVASLLLYNNGAVLLCQCFPIIPCSNAVMTAYYSNQLSNLKAKYSSYNEMRHEKVASLLLYNNGATALHVRVQCKRVKRCYIVQLCEGLCIDWCYYSQG
ncbi:hypothetical protein FQR65_LT13889 [Abscondita terminalis]|nr:hypothetical protein FQR65_LT13889 [Abscondita terminalis]